MISFKVLNLHFSLATISCLLICVNKILGICNSFSSSSKSCIDNMFIFVSLGMSLNSNLFSKIIPSRFLYKGTKCCSWLLYKDTIVFAGHKRAKLH